MVGFRGRFAAKQYMPNKPTKWGIRCFTLADSANGYVLNVLVYTGRDTLEDASNESRRHAGTLFVLHLVLSVDHGSGPILIVMSRRGSTSDCTLLSSARSTTALSAVLQVERADHHITARPAQRNRSSALATASSGTILFYTTSTYSCISHSNS